MINIKQASGVMSEQNGGIKALNCTDLPTSHWIVEYQGHGNSWSVALNVNQSDNKLEMTIRDNLVFLGAE